MNYKDAKKIITEDLAGETSPAGKKFLQNLASLVRFYYMRLPVIYYGTKKRHFIIIKLDFLRVRF
jgi:hypothetical protein